MVSQNTQFLDDNSDYIFPYFQLIALSNNSLINESVNSSGKFSGTVKESFIFSSSDFKF